MRKQFRHLSSLEEAMDVLETLAIEPVPTTTPLASAGGRVLASSIEAPMDVPGFDRSIMDGYAVRAADTVGAYDDDPAELAYAGSVVPGEEPTVHVGPGEAAEIATGAVIPDGADAVVMVEETSRRDDTISVYRAAAPREHVMSRGADIAAGETVLRGGDRLDARRIGLLAALGVDEVPVVDRPTVGIVSTGGEIVRPTEADALDAGEIFDINSFSMATAIERAGASARIFPHAEDSYEAIKATLETAAAETDLVVSSGSTSASAEDVVYRVVEAEGELLLHGIAVKPGKPTVFGRLDGTPVLGMPGNPISALMNFRLFVQPMLQWALGERGDTTATREATLRADIDSVGGRTQLAPVGLIEAPTAGLVAYPVDKGSGAITSLADADGYVTIDADVHYRAAGSAVTVTLLDAGTTPPALLLCGDTCPAIDATIEGVDAEVRWLDQGGIDGLRKVRDGIADAAAVGVPTSTVADYGLDGVERRRGYERRIGFLTPDGAPVEDGATVATLPRDSDLHAHLERLAESEGIELEVRDRPSTAGLVRAVASGAVDAALVLEAAVADRDGDLTFEPVGWTELDLYVASDRADKPGIEQFEASLAAVLESPPPGIRVGDPVGTVRELP